MSARRRCSSRRRGRAPLAFLLALPCAVLAGCERSEPAPAPSISRGSERMVRRLALMAERALPMRNPFMNHERLALLRRIEEPTEMEAGAQAELELANELLRAGFSHEAEERFGRLVELLRRHGSTFGSEQLYRVRALHAVAHLRIGEQENCLDAGARGHSADSCLLPISAAGVHRRQSGSRAALSQLASLLRERPDDLTNRWLYNLAAMTVGEYPEAVPAEWVIPPRAFASDFDVGRFYDVAAQVGLDAVGLAGGSILEDLDGDGYLDAMASSWGLRDALRYFRNRRDGTFEERSSEAGLDGITGGLNLVHADYDNDGDADVFVLRGAWLGAAGRFPNSLLRNRGDGSFDDVTEEAGLLSFHPTQTAAWGDYDNDGWLDLYIGNESLPGELHPCQLYRSNGAGADGVVTFRDVAREAGVEARGFVKGVVWGDYDNDGWLDLYVSRLLEPNQLFRNRGDGAGGRTFDDVAAEAGVVEPAWSFPTFFFDYDNDGWLDLFASGYSDDYLEVHSAQVAADYLGLPIDAETPRLYHNRGDGTFADVTAAAGLDHVLLAMGANYGDLDNDGYLDVYLGTGAPDFRALVPNRMFRNDEGRVFQDVTTAGGFGHLQKGHGISFGDVDNDGDQDLFMVVGGAYSGDVYGNALFANPGSRHRWITLRLEGVRANRSAIGARIRLELLTPQGSRQVFATVSSGGSFGASSLQQELGLGDATAITKAEISWPGGEKQVVRGLPLDRVVQLREGDPEPRVVAAGDRE